MPKLQLHNRNMHYEDHGNGFPLLLGHSYLFDAEMWRPQIEALSKYYRVIVPDLWGHGNSEDLPEGHQTLTDLAQDYLALMDHLKITHFAVIGLSVGGMWGTELAAIAKERCTALVLMDTFVGREPEVTHQRYFAMMDAIEQAGTIPLPLLEQIVPLFFRRTPDPALTTALSQHLAALSAQNLRNSIVPLGRMIFGRPDRCNLLEQMNIPALVVTGEQDMPRPPQEGHLMAEKLNCNQTIVADAGHICTLEQPQRVNTLLLEFLAQTLPA
ncbi:alpha/beta fold hydrolase [Halodesulfovibrio marinisediminis]|uniref:Pimeloyl-ACP methyl ester carboxylesterase n=1 Tax=Halodesulfovibrio marinisediminis DSM 17456 TaxID=1121457 RepID=A0A1N6H5N4_9BACT|nr:alpha/beta fold hydrolase [Halodesulfovibrio marinisediminis]SIO15069.1 Pimeloyl-ACP methyl ester carboxylesterase [Halodesulfovibrio marinisediminis DSM 17456]